MKTNCGGTSRLKLETDSNDMCKFSQVAKSEENKVPKTLNGHKK